MTIQDLPEEIRSLYKELKTPSGKVVGLVCVECGRLQTAPHKDSYSVGGATASGESEL